MKNKRKNNPLLEAFFYFYLCTASNSLFAEDEQSNKKRSLFEKWFNSFEDMHDKQSSHYMSMVRSIDTYFSGEKIEDANNESYARVELKNTFYKSGEQSDGISIDAKVELPNTEKHLKLIFSSDPEEDKTLEEKITNNADGQRVEKESSIAGIEYTPEIPESPWKHNFSTGIKLRVSPIPFIQYKFGRKWQLDKNWSSGFKQSFWGYHDEGLGATTKLNFARPITEKDAFTANTEVKFKDEDDKYTYAQTFSNTHRLSEQSAVIYSTGAFGESQPTNQVTNYFIGAEYRRALYKDWLLLQVHPLLEFPREQNWEATPSLTFTLKIYFAE